ncbi:MAG TPA: HupE/UreJ family protein [Candidatus Binatia bacterium]|nr:HupE/UreJ family protein [Candidatus Binatia bacterium]
MKSLRFGFIAPRRQACKVTSEGLSSRANARDLRKIPPFGRNDKACFLGADFDSAQGMLYVPSTWLRTCFAGVTALLVLSPVTAFAHEQTGAAAGFLTGFAHPVSGLDHMIAMIAVGLWGAQLGTPAVFLLPVAFPMVMAIGGMLGLMGVPLPGIEIGIAVSAVVLGAVVLASAQPRLWIALVIVGFFAIFHGHAHGTELPAGQSGLLYSIGFVIATGLLHACGILIGLAHRWPIGRVALRAAGAVVSIAGMAFLWRAIS